MKLSKAGNACVVNTEKSVHPRDARITFEAEGHAYYIDGERAPASVTAVWQRHFPDFDPGSTLDRYFCGWAANPSSKYHSLIHYLRLVRGFDVEDQKGAIAALWDAQGKCAAAEGTYMHYQIESLLRGYEIMPSLVGSEMCIRDR